MRVLRLLNRSKLLLALAAATLSLQTQFVLGISASACPLVVLFLCTLSFYRLHYWYNFNLSGIPAKRWWSLLPVGLIALLLASAIAVGFAISCCFTSFQTLALCSGILLSAAYTFPLLPAFAGRRWKAHPWHKIIVLALMWTWLTTLPMMPQFAFTAPALLLMAGRFFFVFAICIPFDVRDAVADRKAMKYTLADRYGIRQLRHWIWISIMLSIGFHTWLLSLLGASWMVVALLACHGLFTAWLAIKAFGKPRGHDVYLWIDLQMIVLPLLLAALQFANQYL